MAWALVGLIAGIFLAMAWLMPAPLPGARLSYSWASNYNKMEPVYMWLSYFSAAGVVTAAALLDDGLWA